MKKRKRSAGFALASLCIFTLLLAGCRGTSSTSNTTTRTNSRLTSLQQTPTTTASATPVGTQTYLGQVPNKNAWIGITTDGKTANAFVTDGTQGHPATFAQWFSGTVNNNSLDTKEADKNGDDRLQAMLTNATATGTVTMAGGQSIAFTANALPSSAGSPTPSATGTATATGTASPSATGTASTALNPGLYKGTGSSNGNSYEAGWLVVPASMVSGTATPSATATGAATPGATATTGATPTTTASPTGAMQQAGAVINTKTHDVTTAPPLTQNDVSNGSVSVPNVGTLKLSPCQGNQC